MLKFVLVHSPLVGTLTWSRVADELRKRGVPVVTPELSDDGGDGAPYWRQHIEAVARALSADPVSGEVVLAGHSGAGPLLPAIGEAIAQPVRAYFFVDAGIPVDGLSRLAMMEREDPEFAAQLRSALADGVDFPDWDAAALAGLVPEAGLRARLVADLRPRGLAYFEEPLPVPANWPDAPCAYLQFSAAYDYPARLARESGWAFLRIDAGHFHPLVAPAEVAEAMLALVDRTGRSPASRIE